MKESNEKLIQILEHELNVLESQTGGSLQIVEQRISLLQINLKKIRENVILNGFKSSEEEIHFFKHTKPRIFAKLIFYTKRIGIENKRCRGCMRSQVKYLNKEIALLQEYINENAEFHLYLKRGASELDKYYFIRNNDNIRIHESNLYCFADEQFSTSHDSIVATLIAFKDLIKYLQLEINKLETKNLIESITQKSLLHSELHWTGSKTNLIELIYALQSSGMINSGAADIKEITLMLQRVFNIDLGNYYQTFVEIRSRKSNQTKFLDNLKESFINRLEEFDK